MRTYPSSFSLKRDYPERLARSRTRLSLANKILHQSYRRNEFHLAWGQFSAVMMVAATMSVA